MKQDLAIFGAGGFGRELACMVREMSQDWNLLGFFDDAYPVGTKRSHWSVIGGLQELNTWPEPIAVAMAVATPKTMIKLLGMITNPMVKYPNIIAPDTLWIDPESCGIGQGNIVTRRCTFSCNVRIGNFNIINGDAVLGHDTTVGNYNAFMTSVRIAGEVSIGDRNYFGTSSVVLQQKRIGCDTTIGSGSVVMTNTKDNCTYIGNPATIFRI